MQAGQPEAKNREQQEPAKSRSRAWLRLLPYFVTGVIGLIALAEMLKEHGPSAAAILESILKQLQSFSPYHRQDLFVFSFIDHTSHLNIIGWLWDLTGIPAIIAAFSSGFIGIFILVSSLGLFVVAILFLLRPPDERISDRFGYLFLFPLVFPQYSFVAKYSLEGLVYLSNQFISLTVAVICWLAGLFFGVKALAAPLEIYEGVRATKEIAKAAKGSAKGR